MARCRSVTRNRLYIEGKARLSHMPEKRTVRAGHGDGRVDKHFWKTNCAATSASAGQYFGCEQSVHGARAKAFEVERHKLESESFEDASELRRHLGTQRAGQFLVSNFDTHNVPMMTDTKLAEAQSAERVFALFDNAEGCARNLASVLNAGRQAGGSGLVPYTKAGGARELPNFLLGESGFA